MLRTRILYGFVILLVGLAMSVSSVNAQVAKDMKKKAKNAFTGKVVDASTGQPLADVAVQVKGQDIKATTDKEGNFTLDDIQGTADAGMAKEKMKSGEMTIEINHEGYQPFSKTINLHDMMGKKDKMGKGKMMTFKLKPEGSGY